MLRNMGAVVMATLIFSTTTYAQDAPEICYGSSQHYTPIDTSHTKRQLADVSADERGLPQEESRPSYWGYRHKSLHKRGIIDQILKNANSSCCGGTDSGECRVTTIDAVNHTAVIDGKDCPITGTPAMVAVEGLENDEDAVVCASRTQRSGSGNVSYAVCPTTYCIGTRGGY